MTYALNLKHVDARMYRLTPVCIMHPCTHCIRDCTLDGILDCILDCIFDYILDCIVDCMIGLTLDHILNCLLDSQLIAYLIAHLIAHVFAYLVVLYTFLHLFFTSKPCRVCAPSACRACAPHEFKLLATARFLARRRSSRTLCLSSTDMRRTSVAFLGLGMNLYFKHGFKFTLSFAAMPACSISTSANTGAGMRTGSGFARLALQLLGMALQGTTLH